MFTINLSAPERWERNSQVYFSNSFQELPHIITSANADWDLRRHIASLGLSKLT